MNPDGRGHHPEFMCETCESNSCYHLLLAGRVTSIHMSETAVRPSPLDNDDLLREILLRLPPQPSSLPRASVVRKRWRRLISDPQFHSRFRAHHRKAPLLGFFSNNESSFRPVLDPPDRVDPERFSLEYLSEGRVLGCRHGRVLFVNNNKDELAVCDPVTGEHVRVPLPSGFTFEVFSGTHGNHAKGTVVCADGGQGHVHGSCHSSPFKVILVSMHREPAAIVYSSETGMWGNIVRTAVPGFVYEHHIDSSILLGNSIYWLLRHGGILEFNLDSMSLTVIEGPPTKYSDRVLIQGEDGGVGIAVRRFLDLHMWHRKVDCHGVPTWVLWKTVDLHNILGIPKVERDARGRPSSMGRLMGYAEDADAIIVEADSCVFMVQLESMQSKRLYETKYLRHIFHPFTSFFCTGGTAITGGHGGAQILHDA